ncbi:MAG: DNA primase [Candidatus Levyibacteriota bacterium]|nr:MAG: DNA primase [Candidatus Levybacteria bacterium]
MDQVAQVREKTDLVSFISEYVPLKKTGRNFKAPCPFHTEKTPSFVVSPERQIWHCFGCQKGGDCFTFLMEYENLEFPEALRILAKKVGVELSQTPFQSGVSSKKEKIYILNRQAMEFYHYVLTKHAAGKKALEYLSKDRHINPKVLETFMVGFAPANGNALASYLLTKKKHVKEDLIEAGLSFNKTGRIVDFFVNRIIFPLLDHRGNVEGFSGRVMDPKLQPKYVNTRETLVYHKGKVFFGLNMAKDEIKKEERAIIMEGEFDVMSSFQEGVGNAVAVKGTALTEAQVNLIARFCPKVSLCFDTDSAGQEAIVRSLLAIEKKGLLCSVVVCPNAKDPDEAVQKDSFAFKQAVKHSIPVYDFLLEKVLSEVSVKSAEGKKRASDDLLPIFNNIENEVVKEHYLKKLAQEIDTTYESVVKQTQHFAKQAKEDVFIKRAKDARSRKEIIEEYLLSLLLQYKIPQQIVEKIQKDNILFSFSVPSYQKIAEHFFSYTKAHSTIDMQVFLKGLPSELFDSFDRCYLLPLPLFIDDKAHLEEILKIEKELYLVSLRENLKKISDQLKKNEKEETEEFLALQQEFSRLTSLLSDAQK